MMLARNLTTQGMEQKNQKSKDKVIQKANIKSTAETFVLFLSTFYLSFDVGVISY